jgi:D-sedoheptulose 7-phosphate isomerase
MDLISRISENFSESAHLQLQSMDALAGPIAAAAERMVQCLRQDGKILGCGNGGSAAGAQHFSAQLLNRFELERPGLAAITLTADSSTLTSIADDHDYVQIFSRQVRALGHAGDILLAISTNGSSRNIIAAAEAAHECQMDIVALTGHTGGKLAELLRPEDINICVPASTTARIHEVHLLVLHCLCDAIDCLLLGVE